MNIWKILGIEPTTDKKAIRKAYAAKTKVIHPEDAPEEFKRRSGLRIMSDRSSTPAAA